MRPCGSLTVLAIALIFSAVPGRAATPVKALEITPKNARLIQSLGNYPDLEVLSISCLENLRSLPDSIGKLTRLRELIMDNGNGCAMSLLLPESIGNLRSLQTLVLDGTVRQQFPSSMSHLKELVYLDLGRNGLNKIPSFVKELPKLTTLKLDFNDLDDLPDFLNTLPKLASISLSENNKISCNAAKMESLKRKFPRIAFGFENEYDDCPLK
jgi:Leucine-rich repeat (LRR) protein